MAKEGNLQSMRFMNLNSYIAMDDQPQIQLSFEKVVDPIANLNFVVMVYQECYETKFNNILIYDIQ